MLKWLNVVVCYPCQFCVEERPGRWYMRLRFTHQKVNWVLNLKGSIWRLLSLPWDAVCKNSIALKIWCFCSSLPWDVFLPLIYQLSFKDLNIFLASFKLATGFHEIMFCHLVDSESAKFNFWDWISGLYFKQSHELRTDCVLCFHLWYEQTNRIWGTLLFYDLTFDRNMVICIHKGF